MLEGELEAAICKAFRLLLPDLFREGYRIKSSQAILLGRRIDLLLEASDGRTCIIELKAGAPPMPHVRDQILDYAECWRQSFPEQTEPRLIVVGNAIPERTEFELANFGVESRAIAQAEVLRALKRREIDDAVLKGLKLIPDDLGKVRHLLSDHAAVAVPDGVVLGPPWSQAKVFWALVRRGEKHKDLWKKSIYVHLYKQRQNSAIVYGPKVEVTKGYVHFNPRAPGWNEEIFQRLKPNLEYVRSDNKGPGKEGGNFDWYRVRDWNRLAAVLGL